MKQVDHGIETNLDLIGVYTGLTEIEQDCISNCIKNWLPYGETTYIELGCLYGGNFKYQLETFKENNFSGIAIDLFENFVDLANETGKIDGNTHGGNVTRMADLNSKLKSFGLHNFILIKGDTSTELSKLVPIENCVIFIDGDHSYEGCLKDWEASNSKIFSGYVVFHDCDWDGPGRVVNEIRKYGGSRYNFVGYFGRCGVIEIR